MYTGFSFTDKISKIHNKSINNLKKEFERIDNISEYNQQKVLSAFINNNVSAACFAGSTGYGYDDLGRDKLEKVFADSVGAESALYRHNLMSGTHALCVALFGVLRPNDTVLCVTGEPYDTIKGVFGIHDYSGSLKDFNVNYEQIDFTNAGLIDFSSISERLNKEYVKVVYIQRSRGYLLRHSLTVNEIKEIVDIVKSTSPETLVMVDNCYGEFVQIHEPTDFGADLIIGSLIKNAGGGIAPTGGYIAGKTQYVELCAGRLTTPSTGGEIGATLNVLREMYLGLYFAPHSTTEALKTACFASEVFKQIGFETTPNCNEERGDIIQVIRLKNRDQLIAFCKGLQKYSPVDSFVSPEPAPMPGYNDEVIMASGSFTLGSSIELSADAPLREPFCVWMQGGLNFETSKLGVLGAAEEVLKVI